MGINYGYQNEYDFVELFNNKFLNDLDKNTQLFLRDIFGEAIDNSEKIVSWKNKTFQKTDIFIKYKNYIKNISLKCGNSNSIHHEPLQEFKRYLEKKEIPYKTIDKYVSYHYGYKRDKDGRIDYNTQLDCEEYKVLYQDEIDCFNDAINKTRIIIDMIDRFIVYGNYSDYAIDVLVSGTVDDYVWIKRDDLYDLILSKRDSHYTSPHFACITIGPKKRNINSSKYDRDRYIVAVRWNNIKDSIINYKNIIKNVDN